MMKRGFEEMVVVALWLIFFVLVFIAVGIYHAPGLWEAK
jgi:hypothetical protein